MTFEQFWETKSHYVNMDGKAWCKSGWNGAVENMAALPERAHFDDGVEVGKVMAAKECEKIVMDWICSQKQFPTQIIDAIRDKFRTER